GAEARPIRLADERRPVHRVKPLACGVAATGLRKRTTRDADDVCGVVEAGPVHERGANPVDIDGHAEFFEAPDLLGVETARGDDPNVSIPVAIERLAQQLD